MRSLASIVTVKAIEKMFEKDRIVSVQFNELGYEAIVPVTYKVGDSMVFIQEGSILPETPTWEFLRKRCFKESLKGFLISPMTMGKKEATDENGNIIAGERVRSWGLAVGLNECGLTDEQLQKLKPGDDITDLLGIRKYEPEEDASPTSNGSSKKAYPKWVKFCLSHSWTRWIGRIWQSKHTSTSSSFPTSIISKSDETTIQNYSKALERFADELVYTSVKMEGQSCTALFDYDEKKKKLGEFYVCSRNNAYKGKSSNDFWTTAIRLDVEKKLKKYFEETGKLLVLQVEQCGPGIQDNIYDLKETDWFVYTIKDIITGEQLPINEMIETCKKLELKTVPIIETNVSLKSIMPDIPTAVAYAENKYWVPGNYFYEPKENQKLWEDYFQHEGVVVRSMNYDKDSNRGVSFKVKNCDYGSKKLGTIHQACVALKS